MHAVRHRNANRPFCYRNKTQYTDLVKSGEKPHDPRVRWLEHAAVARGRSLQNLGDERRDRDKSTSLVPLLIPPPYNKPASEGSKGGTRKATEDKQGREEVGKCYKTLKWPHYQYNLPYNHQVFFTYQVPLYIHDKRTQDSDTDLTEPETKAQPRFTITVKARVGYDRIYTWYEALKIWSMKTNKNIGKGEERHPSREHEKMSLSGPECEDCLLFTFMLGCLLL